MNKFKIEFDAVSENESFARMVAAIFAARLDPTIEEINDLKTAISEAVTNAIIHGYSGLGGIVYMQAELCDRTITVTITDTGKGIEDVNKAMEPMYTTCMDSERSGMGFTFMEVFMDSLKVESAVGKGTTVTMTKTFKEIEKEK